MLSTGANAQKWKYRLQFFQTCMQCILSVYVKLCTQEAMLWMTGT